MTVKDDKLEISDKIKFYFWINVAGVCQMTNPETGLTNEVFKACSYVKANPKHINGFKLMNDEKEMLNLILPDIKN